MNIINLHHVNWQETFYICASIGAIATAMSLVYLFIKDFWQGKRISNIEKVAETLQKDLELKYQPHLWINGVSMRNQDGTINFDLNNKREWCKLIELNMISGDLRIDENNLHLPYELEPKFDPNITSTTNRRYLFFINDSAKHLDDCDYKFEIVYLDRLDKKYKIVIEGTGGNYKISQPINFI